MSGSTLMERAIKRGIFLDAEFKNGVAVRPAGDPWFPPIDMPLIHCEHVYQMAHEAPDGTGTCVSAFDEHGEPRHQHEVVADGLKAQQTSSHLEQLLMAFDEGPEEHNPPMLCQFDGAWLEFGGYWQGIRAAAIVSDADSVGHINAWHITQAGDGHVLMIASARYWNGGLERSTQLSAAGNKVAASLIDFMEKHHEALYGTPATTLTGLRSGAHGDSIADHVVDDLRLRVATCGSLRIPNTRGVNIVALEQRLGKKQKRLRPHQQIRRHILTITGSEGGARRKAARGRGEAMTAEHLVRAHWVCYSEDRPMFGIPGRYGWWRRQAHKRGKRINGLVNQVRRIEPA